MFGQVGARRMETAEVDDARHAVLLSRGHHILRGTPLFGREVRVSAHRVDQVVDDVHTREGLDQRIAIRQITPDHLGRRIRQPRCVGELLRCPRQCAHTVPACQ